jgi:predicted ATPase
MLQELTIKNFKLFDDTGVTIRPGKITVFIGANGTGKSSVLQMLLLLKQSRRENRLISDGLLINIGSFRDVVHLHDVARKIAVEISVSYQDFVVPGRTNPALASSGTFQYQVYWGNQGQLSDQTVTIGGQVGEAITSSWSSSSLSHTEVVVEGVTTIPLKREPWVGFPIRMDSTSDEWNAQIRDSTNAVFRLLTTIDTLLEDFYFVPAIRGFDHLTYEFWAGEQPSDLSAAGGPEKQASLVSNIIASQPELADEVAERLNTILNGNSRLRSRLAQGQVGSETANGRRSTNLLNEAFGLNQLIAPLLWLSKTPRGAVIGIEEPEIHLHPRAQAALCDVFVDVATRERKQLILTTHSEHILMGLLTAVAQGRLQPDDLAVYEFRREGDAARAERLAVTEYGQVAGGLRGFLEADIDEIGELIEARFQQRRR